MRMKKAGCFIVFLALIMAVTAGSGRAWAYFTTYASAEGGITIALGDRTEIEEKFSNWEKRVTITSDPDSEPVYIRAKAFGSGSYPLTCGGEGWSDGGDGYYYYDKILSGGEETSVLSVKIGNVPENDVEDGTMFNVVVIYESAPVEYRDDKTPYADWGAVLDNGISQSGGGNKEEE